MNEKTLMMPKYNAFLHDQILALLHRESVYISSSTNATNHSLPLLHINNRESILKWYHTYVVHFQYDLEVVTTSMDFLDRFLLSYSKAEDISGRFYKLVAMTSLYLAIKLNVGNALPKRKVQLQEYISSSGEFFSPLEFSSTERCILDTLNWRVHPVSPMCFVRYFVKLMEPIFINEVTNTPSSNTASEDRTYGYVSRDLCLEAIREIALYFTELAMFLTETTEYFYINGSSKVYSTERKNFTPSAIAYASILLSMDMISYLVLHSVLRESFLKNCTQLGTQNRHPLHPNRRDVKELRVGIRDNFRLDKFLERSTARCRRPNRGISSSKTYPIGEAIHCGMMLNLRCAIETTEKVDCEGFRFSPMSSRGTPWSMSFHQINRANARVSVYNPIRKPMV